jgi:formylmethanofuran dehydrogenase subunit B
MSRYSLFPRGFFTVKGHKGRKVICVDCRYTDTARCADKFIQVDQGFDYELLDAFRIALQGGSLPDKVGGVPKGQIYEVVEALKSAKFGIIFVGMGLSQSIGRNHNVDMAINLTYLLNCYTKFSIMPMRSQWNVTGSGEVLGWQYGFPYAVDLSRGDQARHQTGETTSIDLLTRNEVEACFYIATDPAAHFPVDAIISSSRKPTVTIDPHINCTTELSDLHIPVAMVGIEAGGCAYRMDHIPIEMRKVVDPPEGLLTDVELLTRINQRIDEMLAAGGASSQNCVPDEIRA